MWHPYLLTPGQLHPVPGCRLVGTVPAGTRIRIGRLTFDTGEGSLLWVTASLDNGRYPKRVVYLDEGLLARNIFLSDGTSRIWGVNPKYLESDGPPRKAKGGEK